MKKFFSNFWAKFQKVGFIIGNIISGIFLFIFYYSIFAIFAIPFRLFSDPLASISKSSNWRVKKANTETLEDFKNE